MQHDEQYCTFYILLELTCVINVFVFARVLMFSLINLLYKEIKLHYSSATKYLYMVPALFGF